ncbi:TonB-dependent receptor plug domain-containing protein [Flavobacterium sp. UBA6135]|uniref:TonB-dependent receptor plug domain-containing protein n=1 Tax=Flavobacterium sp. UBA6135 TaxID=1946553 RepID=UPI0025BC20BA|nr:TonB-dependent receptor plug domain-containing protein [Flavobacterium sp. UBA6135]
MNQKFSCCTAILALWGTCAFAQQDTIALSEVVISDTKFAQSKEKSGKIIEKITAKDLERNTGQSVATILSQAVGLEVNGNQSANGKNLSYFIRGGRNRQVLIVIDGIPMTDASGINFEYDLRLLPAEQVESIEIMKGAASTLYGTGAASGVINITLKKSAKKEVSGNAYMHFGTQNTTENFKANQQDFNQGFGLNGTVDKIDYYASLNSTETKGISQAAGENFEEDRFSRVNALAKIGFQATSKLKLDFFSNYDRMKTDYDGPFDNFSSPDVLGNVSLSEQFRFGFNPKYKYNKGEFIVNSGFTLLERSYDEFNSWSSTLEEYTYTSRSVVVDAVNKYTFNKNFFVVTGTQFQFHDMNTQTPFDVIERETANFNLIDPYLTAVYNSSFGLHINAGARMNLHSVYDNQLVYNFNPSYHFKKFPLKIITSYSTAYITPSLYQLYSPYGNLELTPEENATAEVGFETTFSNKKITFSAVGFYRAESNSIGFFFNPDTFDSYYVNVDGENNVRGFETTLSYQVSSKLRLNGNYTFTDIRQELNRLIPKHKGNAAIDFQANDRTLVSLNYQYVDGRRDAFFDGGTFATTDVFLDSYQLINGLIKYDVLKNRMSVFGAVNNILNEEFVETVGYNTRGRNVKLGFTFLF